MIKQDIDNFLNTIQYFPKNNLGEGWIPFSDCFGKQYSHEILHDYIMCLYDFGKKDFEIIQGEYTFQDKKLVAQQWDPNGNGYKNGIQFKDYDNLRKNSLFTFVPEQGYKWFWDDIDDMIIIVCDNVKNDGSLIGKIYCWGYNDIYVYNK